MRVVLISVALAAVLAAGAPPALAQAAKPRAAAKPTVGSPTVNDDVRCMLAMVAFSNINKDHPQAGQAGVYYFAGRISARAPAGYDLTAAVRTQAQTLGPQQLQAEVQRCGPMVNGAAQHVQAAIGALRPAGAPAGAAPGPAAAAPAAPTPATPPAATAPK